MMAGGPLSARLFVSSCEERRTSWRCSDVGEPSAASRSPWPNASGSGAWWGIPMFQHGGSVGAGTMSTAPGQPLTPFIANTGYEKAIPWEAPRLGSDRVLVGGAGDRSPHLPPERDGGKDPKPLWVTPPSRGRLVGRLLSAKGVTAPHQVPGASCGSGIRRSPRPGRSAGLGGHARGSARWSRPAGPVNGGGKGRASSCWAEFDERGQGEHLR